MFFAATRSFDVVDLSVVVSLGGGTWLLLVLAKMIYTSQGIRCTCISAFHMDVIQTHADGNLRRMGPTVTPGSRHCASSLTRASLVVQDSLDCGSVAFAARRSSAQVLCFTIPCCPLFPPPEDT